MTPIGQDIIYNILVVEDDAGLQYLIKSKIEDEKYNVLIAGSGADALNLIKTEQIFLMLLDYKLSDITGKELLQQLQKEDISVPFIFMTGFGDEKIAVEIMKLGAKEYLVKTEEFLNQIPVTVSRVIKEIENDEKLLRMQKELESLNNMKSHFLNMISQEIRAPLTGISGALHLLRNQEFSSTIKGLLETLQSSVYRLDDFANKTILSTQLSSGKYELNLTNINAKELIEYCYLELTNEVIEKQIEIKENIDSETVIRGDKDLLYKAFLYLIENAVTRSKPKSVININIKKKGDYIKVSIIDNSDIYIENPTEFLLNPFQSIDHEAMSNFGLSLFIVNQIVELHQGEIEIRNIENAGICVDIVLSNLGISNTENE